MIRNVAIAWAGSPSHDQGRHRDIPLEEFLRLAEVPGVRLHSFQVGDRAKDIEVCGGHGVVLDRSPEITNMADSARLLKEMDLLVCCDTSIGHLGGAIGLPTWLLLNQRGLDFRWGRRGEQSPWYASQRLFRRGLDESWRDVMLWVVEELGQVRAVA